MTSLLQITLISCAVLGFRHGFDYDHIAAISDITSVQRRTSTAMRLGLLYAIGHATMIALLGGIVVVFQFSLPQHMDAWAERLVGLTLIVLAVYVMGSLVWGNAHALPPSRAAIIIRSYRKLRQKIWPPGSSICPYTDENLNYTGPMAFGIGLIHGLGAETPSQLALFLLAANLGGIAKGAGGMGMFLAGLLIMNTVMTAFASGLFHRAAPHPHTMRFFVGLTAVYSFIVGWIFLLGSSAHLPHLA